ncbi:ribosomal RNA-processing protein 14-C [Brachypodium distachyon]|uniref:Ribosomal RNA-processing protein 14/surfeit locus protein 6 C-terminal domain-containing protein n=1 Tax=Brachypodium distachyon TaxID=15368 RepID=I1GNY7_BRADI|nr:ribosomal RNA-processing protein 14-C [Brachypodium distachyon]XP_024312422.1 ribosomal RNA-processing protein 14-C [Brachypodium distachyon]XP_024312423.1 ribosomal RNA-processing protein 14-C [Brachypodium distachyon]XP_024312424.1 ribosomal RNA-processing protein 14-C [Brachypodium distachyon]KQK13506.1 hypothetical protein BRADI_1g10600v3 [Brachypodium distachyon]KQK13507.1 hypothetical protein BRADI_1g10600v3 [Brachypodium distachyon]KQK13508.1 hypothetical protein BRADI_1g10600v3 [Br|eukprot:XP_003560581.1 ribosomal RNA-processing protein 14-C [Brachypodium distachyon]
MGRKPSASAAAAAAADHESLAASAKAAELLAAAANCDGVQGHSLFFDALVQLIPPRFYLSAGDEDRPYYQGLSKSAKAAMKAQSRANIKAARRARLDPAGPPSSTLDLLKKSVADQEAEGDQDKSQDESNETEDEAGSEDDEDEDEDEEEEEEGEEEEEIPMAPAAVVSEDRSVTYEELRERLHRRITELRGNRCTSQEFLNKPQKEKGKKVKGTKVKGKDGGMKRKREDGAEDADGADGKKHKKQADEKAPDIMYGNVLVDPKEARRRKKRRVKNKKKELEQAKRMQRAKEDPKKATKMAWDVATRRAAGEKVHDNPKLIKESMKKDKKRQQKHAEQWKDRQKTVDSKRKEKQNTRKENIKERAQQKKMRKIEKREKKLIRPGFEGRKQGYVNE